MRTTATGPLVGPSLSVDDLPPVVVTTEDIPDQERLPSRPAHLAPARSTHDSHDSGMAGVGVRRWLVLVLPLLSTLLAVTWLLAGAQALAALQGTLTRAPIPGTAVVSVHEGDWYVYSEPGVPGTTITVRAPDGSLVPVTPLERPAYYGTDAVQVATFHVGAGRSYAETYTVTADNARTTIATMSVGTTDLTAPVPAMLAGMSVALVVANLATMLVLVPLLRRRTEVLDLHDS